jgi:hypothetical protein
MGGGGERAASLHVAPFWFKQAYPKQLTFIKIHGWDPFPRRERKCVQTNLRGTSRRKKERRQAREKRNRIM